MPLDYSKRVSPKEHVDAFYAWVGRRCKVLAIWVRSRPLRRRLRRLSVSTTLGVAGIMLTFAGLLLVIGIAETTIVASENAGNHTANLFANGWFDGGLFLAGLGILIGTLAVAANGSHTRALKDFPDIEIRSLIHTANDDVEEPGHPDGLGQRGRLHHVRLLIRSNERTRPVTLSVCLSYLVVPGTFPANLAQHVKIDSKAFDPTTWIPTAADVRLPLGVHMLESPIHVDAQTQREGDVFFFVPEGDLPMLESNQRPTLSAVDLRTHRYVTFFHGYPLDELLI